MPAPSTITVAIPSDVRTLSPRGVEDTFSFLVCNQVFEGLTRFADGSIEIEPALAESWSFSNDYRTWTFRLRTGITFSDGSVMTAADVVSAFSQVKDFGGKCSAKDSTSVSFALKEPNSHFIDLLAQMPFAVMKEGEGFAIGTGPYRIESRRLGREITLVRNEKSSRNRPHIDKVIFKVIQFTTLLGKGLVDGEVDLSDSVTPAMLPILRKSDRVKIHYQMGLNTGFLAINTSRPHLSDPRIRMAIATAIDRSPMLQQFFPTGYGAPARTALPPAIFKGTARDFHPYNPDKARQLLAAAGYRGEPIRIRPTWAPRPYLPDPPAIAAAISRMLQAVGISIVEESSPTTEEYSSLKANGTFDLIVAGWIADDTIPFTFLADNLLSSRIGRTNIPRYSNPAFDAILHRMRQSSGATMTAAVEEAEAMIARDVPLVPLFHGPQIAAAGAHIVGRILHPASALRLWSLAISRGGTAAR